MSVQALSNGRIQLIRLVCFSFAASSFVIGAWMMIDPASAWGSVGLNVGDNPFVQALYGGAIMGEGTMFALGAIWPVRYLVFFQYLVLYKTFACIAGIAVLLRMDPAPDGRLGRDWRLGVRRFGFGPRFSVGKVARRGELVWRPRSETLTA